jgi:hypothetical protein
VTDEITWHRYVPVALVQAYEALGWTVAPGGPLPAHHAIYSVLMDWAGAGEPREPEVGQ